MYAVLPGVFQKIRSIFVWPGKLVSVSVRYLFYQPMDEKIKTCTLRFPAKENFNMEKASGFDWSIVSQYDVKAKYRLISRKFLGMKFFHPSVRLTNQKPRAFVSVRQTNQIALFSFVCCLSCSRVFISRPYENRSNAISTLYMIAFAPARKSYWIGLLLFTHKNAEFIFPLKSMPRLPGYSFMT